jgi:hypothetical protein
MASILLQLCTFISPQSQLIVANILLKKSQEWIDATLYIQNSPRCYLSPNIDNFIELKNINNKNILFLNNGIIYDSNADFNYFITVSLREKVFDNNNQLFLKYM